MCCRTMSFWWELYGWGYAVIYAEILELETDTVPQVSSIPSLNP